MDPPFYFLGLGDAPLEMELEGQVRVNDGVFICMICGISILRSFSMSRHMREIHLSFDEDYNCFPCKKYFKNRKDTYNHIRTFHKEWLDWLKN